MRQIDLVLSCVWLKMFAIFTHDRLTDFVIFFMRPVVKFRDIFPRPIDENFPREWMTKLKPLFFLRLIIKLRDSFYGRLAIFAVSSCGRLKKFEFFILNRSANFEIFPCDRLMNITIFFSAIEWRNLRFFPATERQILQFFPAYY